MSEGFQTGFTLAGSRGIFLRADDSDKVATFPAFSISPMGCEVMSLGSFETDQEYLAILGSHFRKQGFKIFAAKVTSLPDDKLFYSDLTEIPENPEPAGGV